MELVGSAAGWNGIAATAEVAEDERLVEVDDCHLVDTGSEVADGDVGGKVVVGELPGCLFV